MRVMRRTYEHILAKKTYNSIRRRSARPQAKLVFEVGEVSLLKVEVRNGPFLHLNLRMIGGLRFDRCCRLHWIRANK